MAMSVCQSSSTGMSIYKYRHANLVMPISVCQSGYANLGMSIWVCQSGYANLGMPIWVCQSCYANCGLRYANCGLRYVNHGLRYANRGIRYANRGLWDDSSNISLSFVKFHQKFTHSLQIHTTLALYIPHSLRTMDTSSPLPERDMQSINHLMVKIESILETMEWPKPAFVLGKTWCHHIHTHILDSTITKGGTYRKLHELLNELMRLYDPSFPFTSIQLNDNVTLEAHAHPDNVGISYGLALGQFEGGGLMVYDRQPEGGKKVTTEGTLHDNHRQFVKFNGRLLHKTIPIRSGRRFAMVYFTQGIHGKPAPFEPPAKKESDSDDSDSDDPIWRHGKE